MKTTKCKGCGMPIFFLNNKPLYARPVQVLTENGQWTKGYISHFINCPDAQRFSKKKWYDEKHDEALNRRKEQSNDETHGIS